MLRKIDPAELEEILDKHALWQTTKDKGEKADLREVDLKNADLKHANLEFADFRGADFVYADLRDASLEGADLTGAKLSWAIGNGFEIKTIIDRYTVVYTKHDIAVGCYQTVLDSELRAIAEKMYRKDRQEFEGHREYLAAHIRKYPAV